MAKQDERFIKVLNEGSTWTTNREIWVDKTTGVNYLWLASGYAGGLTPLARRCRPSRRHARPGRRITPKSETVQTSFAGLHRLFQAPLPGEP
ncbi:MAG: DUF6440 family protein [Oscillospiraceae bacterium]